jgi:hypothetical protein
MVYPKGGLSTYLPLAASHALTILLSFLQWQEKHETIRLFIHIVNATRDENRN